VAGLRPALPRRPPVSDEIGNPVVARSVERIVKRLSVCLILALGLPIAVVVAATEPAAACSCIAQTDAEAFSAADAVFVGKVMRYDSEGQPGSSSDTATWTFKVRDVYKGKVTRIQEVVSSASSASCGLVIPANGVALVFGTANRTLPGGPAPTKGQLFATLCGGSRLVSGGQLAPGLATPHPPRVNTKPH
jgi:hypothetical protein